MQNEHNKSRMTQEAYWVQIKIQLGVRRGNKKAQLRLKGGEKSYMKIYRNKEEENQEGNEISVSVRMFLLLLL